MLIMLLAVVFDISERIEDFLNTKPPLSAIIFDYYQNFVYFYSNLFSSLIVFIAVIFFTSKLAQNSEVIAMLSSGVSFPRFLRPYILAATFLTALSLYSNHFVLPHANKRLLEFEQKYVWNKPTYTNVHREMEKGLYAYIKSYYEGKVDYMWMEKWENGRLRSVFYANRAYCDSTSHKWKFEGYFQRDFNDEIPNRKMTDETDSVGSFQVNDLGSQTKLLRLRPSQRIKTGATLDTVLSFSIKDFGLRTEWSQAMPSGELYNYIQQEKQRGNNDVINYEIELHQRTSYPVATYILTIIAVCVSCRKTRGGIGVHLMIGLLVAVAYIFLMKITSVAATNAGLPAALAVWTPNILFAGVAVFFYRWARR
jgi:lipopolysaccharide export system permease protein